jgi:probable rRNA maturation factor
MASARVDVVNRQRGRKIDLRRWTEFAEKALDAVQHNKRGRGNTEESGATVAFVGDRAIRRLNREFRGRDAVTDVLSFPSGEDDHSLSDEYRSLGDVVIAVPQAERQAEENNLTFDEEIAQLILHGLLHLHGYDHATDAGEMNRLELRLRRRLGIN